MAVPALNMEEKRGMEREITIGEKTIPMRATAATALRYREVFKEDLLVRLDKARRDTNSYENIELYERLAYIMEASAEKKDMSKLSAADFDAWLDGFEFIDMINAGIDIMSLYYGNKETTSTAKKKDAGQSGK